MSNITRGYANEEKFLKEKNLYSLDAFLKQYSDHYSRIAKNIPEEKRIFIKTTDLDNSAKEIATFLNIKENSIQIAHSNKNKRKDGILKELDQSFVRKKIWSHCGDMIQEFFPERSIIISEQKPKLSLLYNFF